MIVGPNVEALFDMWDGLIETAPEYLPEERAKLLRTVKAALITAIKKDMQRTTDKAGVMKRTGWSESTFYRRKKELTIIKGEDGKERYRISELPYGPGEAPYTAEVAKQQNAEEEKEGKRQPKSRVGKGDLRVVEDDE